MKLLSIIKKTNVNRSFLYNKNTLSLIPNISKLAIKFIRNYFYLYNKKIEKKIRRVFLYNKFRKLSKSRIFLSKGEFKHTNNKVIITLYTYNKQKNNYLLKLKKRYINKFLLKMLNLKKKRFNKSKNKNLINKLILLKKLNRITIKGFLVLLEANRFKPKVLRILKKLYEKKKLNKFKAVSKYINKFYKKYLKKIKNILELLFNKNIEFNFINLKHFYLNSNILSESILLKIKKNRRRLMKHLVILKKKIKIRKKKKIIKLKKKKKKKKKKIILGELIIKKKLFFKRYFHNKNLLQNYIINNLKYKHITGFRLKAQGRLNKRYTASRSIYKLKYKGNLLNIDSSYKGLSSVLLRNNLNSNLQYTKLNSKTRIGSFGIKG